eukprot:m.1444466 g.1444466  ORF g.1444466 m.1444466 type:complete len:1052 (+) comp25105_c0_seq7:129-3284(+)
MSFDVADGFSSASSMNRTTYSITFNTADEYDAGTSADVYLAIVGESGVTGDIHVRELGDGGSQSAFKPGTKDTFRFQCNSNLGRLSSVRVWHNNAGNSPGWLLESVRISDEDQGTVFTFPCSQWLADDRDDGQITRVLPVRDDRRLASTSDESALHEDIDDVPLGAVCTTEKWLLGGHGLAAKRLTVDDIQKITAYKLPDSITAVEACLHELEQRRNWMDTESRKCFGTVCEERVAVVVDATVLEMRPLQVDLCKWAEHELGDCATVVLMTMDMSGVRGVDDADGSAQLVVTDAMDRHHRISAMVNWFNTLAATEHTRNPTLVGAITNRVARSTLTASKTLAKSATALTKSLTPSMLRSSTADTLNEPEPVVHNAHGPDTLSALQTTLALASVDGIYMIVANGPLHSTQSISRRVADVCASEHSPKNLTLINYCCDSDDVVYHLQSFKQLYRDALEDKGIKTWSRVHSYTPNRTNGNVNQHSDDIALLDQEVNAARKVLALLSEAHAAHVRQTDETQQQQTSQGQTAPSRSRPTSKKTKRIDSTRPNRTVRLRNERRSGNHPSTPKGEREKNHVTQRLQLRPERPRATDSSTKEMRSKDWLAKYGFRASHLTPYQEFKHMAYSCSKPGLYMGRAYKSLGTMRWHDGTTKTVHIDVPQIARYRASVLDRMRLVNERVRWLGTGTRRVFGNLVGDVVTIVVDTSAQMQPFATLIQSHLRELLETHVVHKQWFNIVRYDRTAEKLHPEMVQVSRSTLDNAYSWISEWNFGRHGNHRNIHAALELATDNLRPQYHGAHSIYLLAAGTPSAPPSLVPAPRSPSTHTITFTTGYIRVRTLNVRGPQSSADADATWGLRQIRLRDAHGKTADIRVADVQASGTDAQFPLAHLVDGATASCARIHRGTDPSVGFWVALRIPAGTAAVDVFQGGDEAGPGPKDTVHIEQSHDGVVWTPLCTVGSGAWRSGWNSVPLSDGTADASDASDGAPPASQRDVDTIVRFAEEMLADGAYVACVGILPPYGARVCSAAYAVSALGMLYHVESSHLLTRPYTPSIHQ